MQKSSSATRSSILLGLLVLGLLATLAILPYQFRSEAGSQGQNKGLNPRTESHEEGLENYDIRADKAAYEKIAGFRQSLNKDAAAIADVRENFVRGEESLKTRIPTLAVEYNTDIRTPEVIAPDVKQGRAFLTSGSSANRAEMLRNFAKENQNLIGVSDAQADALKVTADYTNPDGNLSFAHLEQRINGIPVFRSEIKAGFTKSGEMIRVINNLAPGLDYESLASDFRNPTDAVKAAAKSINYELRSADLSRNEAVSNDLKSVYGEGDWATTAEKMYFPTEPGVAVAAWRVLIWQPVNAYYVIVDAESGTMLWRKNITEDQTQAATYNVYANPNAMINSADSPAPLTPGPIAPTSATQGAIISRSNVTRIGNEAPYTFNNNGWITDGVNVTDGNANEAGIDRVAPNGVDAPIVGSPNRTFSSTWNPAPGSPAPGDDPLTPEAQRGAVIQMFYTMNLYHDEMYRLGFTEQAFNFQADNFGRGGAGADRVSSEAQDSSGTNNANFSSPADGTRGRMQMYLWSGPTPDYDGTTDIDIVFHEVTHGTSNRLHGNSSGLSTNMARGMGEGWSDFYAHAMLSEPTDPINGIYTTGGYATYLGTGGFTSNYYHGIRRFPKAVMAFTGGPNNRPHNPLTFADLNAGCVLTDGAFPRGPFGASQCDAVHNAGEIWSSALWEVRAKYIQRLTWAVGNRKILQHVTDGMKLAPVGPTMIQERDAIIAGAQASGTGADVADLWAGFAIRGMGFSSRVTAPGPPAVVVEAFDSPNLLQTPTFTVTDAAGNNNGFPEPGETVSINLPLTNITGNSATGVTVQIVGGGTANYGTIANGATVSQAISYTIPAGTACGSALNLTFNVNSNLGATSLTRTIIVGVPVTTFTESFDSVTAPAFPAGWTAAVVQGGVNFVTTTVNSDSAPNSAFALNVATVGGGTDLTSPSMPVSSAAAVVTFRHRYDTEGGWDGGVLEISVNSGAFQDVITAGGRFVENGYNGVLGAGVNNPLANRNAWNGLSGGYITSKVQLPATAAGQNVQLRWRFGSDDNTVGTGANPGWNIDGIQVAGSYTCGPVVAPAGDARADFDGDGKTDLSVYRASEGNWYLQRSTAGFGVTKWGVSSDVIVPGDYDNDNKADTAVRRGGDWLILNSATSTFTSINWGLASDTPMAGDYDNDGKTDVAVYRSSNATWYVNQSGGGTQFIGWGAAGDVPVAGDFDGDGKNDLTVYRSGQWITRRSIDGAATFTNWGTAGDLLVPANYDTDAKDDVAVFRPSNGTWYILKSSDGLPQYTVFGQSGDVPVPGDYDGDGRDDQAVYRGGIWYLNRSTAGFSAQNFGVTSDRTIPKAYIP